MSQRLLVVLATYNEADTLPKLIDALQLVLPEAQILVIDDNSPDGTGKWCDEAFSNKSKLEVIHRQGKLGLGTATIRGLKEALKNDDFDLVATMDADLSHDPVELAAMVRVLNSPSKEKKDVVIGSRYIRGGEIHGWPWYRRVASYLVNQYARFVLRLPIHDNTSAMRVYRTETLRCIDLESLRAPGYAYLEEILVVLNRTGARFVEHPIVFKNRETGSSKVDPRELASSLWQILKLSFRSY